MKQEDIKKLEAKSKSLEKEFSGSIKNTQPITDDDKKWLRLAIREEPTIVVTLRLKRWQVERAKQLAKKTGIRGYQTLIRQLLTDALLPTSKAI